MIHYYYTKRETNFGKPIRTQVKGGTHITIEIILKKRNKYIGLRRPKGIPHHAIWRKFPKGALYFCHGLPQWGESIQQAVKRIVKQQAGVKAKSIKVVDIETGIRENKHYAIVPIVIAQIDRLPKPGKYAGNEITEIVTFTKKTIPSDFDWWKKNELQQALQEYD